MKIQINDPVTFNIIEREMTEEEVVNFIGNKCHDSAILNLEVGIWECLDSSHLNGGSNE